VSTPASWIQVGDRRVGYRAAGDGPPVVLVSGLGLSGRFYDRNLAGFADAGLRLIVPDLPGFGETDGPKSGLTVEGLADFLIEFAEALRIRDAGWIGHSLGWQPAALLATRRPELAAAVVAAGPTLPRGHRRAMRQIGVFSFAALLEPFDVYRAVARDYVSTSPTRYIGTWLRHARDTPLDYLPQVRCPFLVVVGSRDPMPNRRDLELIRTHTPNARVVRIPGGTHGLPRQNAPVFNRVVTAFIAEVLAGRRAAEARVDGGG
jgi:2-hydroxy-6-oxonona-2,4-dienedioate hydrolase